MKYGINLISREAQKTLRLLKLKQSLKTAIFGIVGLFVVFALLVLLAFVLVSQIYKSNQNKIAALKDEIKALEKTESYAVVISNRVKGINSILKERKSYLEVTNEIEALSVPGFVLENLEIDNKGDFKIAGACDSRESLAAFNEQVETVEGKKKYGEMVYPAIVRSLQGYYSVSLELKK